VRRRIAAIGLASLLVACTSAVGSPTPAAGEPSVGSASEPPSAGATARPTSPVVVPAAGRPYDAGRMLAAMRDSRRPGGVPDELETDEIAAAVAEQIWTLGGEPWAIMAVGASCGAATCDLEVAGAPAGGAGEDLYLFRADPRSGSVELLQAVLLGIPPATVEALDAYARERWTGDLDGLVLATARWLPPPDDGRFVLAYRSGGEEGTPGLDLLVDVEAGTVSGMPVSRLTRATG
jgi:hypothetical protein